MIRQLILTLLTFGTLPTHAEHTLTTFHKHVLNENFFSEGACYADINTDGHQDIISGPYWYPGPSYKDKHAYTTAERFPIAVYSRHFFSFAHDFNGDQKPDILAIPIPGEPAHWFENPGTTGKLWQKHLAFPWVGNESPTLIDLTGDGQPELLCCYEGKLGYAKPDPTQPTKPWTFTAITEDRGFGRFTHGLGVGDVNSDGRLDVLETTGWWEQPSQKGELFTLHPVRFAESGGAQMFTDDVDGDGDQDVLSVQNAHGYGLCWFEQIRDGNEPQFQRHAILTDKPSDNPYGLSMSQMHAAAVIDIDGDGRKDLVTGKRYWAHGGGDPGSQELPLLYWFKNVQTADGVHFEPWLIDEHSGVGTQLTVGDISGNGHPDIIIGNKLGTFVFIQDRHQVSKADYDSARPQRRDEAKHVAGTDLFALQVRTTPPLSPQSQKDRFILPSGFEIQLVASEPDIAKPMNLAFDQRGRLWVSSSTEYPYAAPSDRTPQDTITILEDTTGDGRADKVTTFADGLNIPMGLYPYGDGVICFSIPYIWYLRDTDGDDHVDVREKLYGPFDYSRDTHGMCNAFTRGLDGWLYACHGFNNQSTVAGTDGHAITMQSGNIFRMRLDGSRLEHVSHGQVNPFGMTFDRYGDLLTADCHTKPISLILTGGYHESFGKPHNGLGFVPNIMEHLHRSTGIAGIALGEATHFPEAYQNSTFGGNVVTSRINRNRLVHRGSSIVAEEEPDFLIAEDPWFRPVDLKVGPDGALYIADFYNSIIGHYEVPLTHPKRDRYRGRIWKIIHQDAPPRPTFQTTTADLVPQLDHANAVLAGLIVDELSRRPAKDTSTAIRTAMRKAAPHARVHLLWTLHRLDTLQPAEILAAIKDDSPLIRTHGFHILAERPDLFPTSIDLSQEPALTQRAAIMASANVSRRDMAQQLIQWSHHLSHDDPHLQHALKLALRQQLTNPESLSSLQTDTFSAQDLQLVASICLALPHREAGRFIIDHLEQLRLTDASKLTAYFRHAARSTGIKTIPKVVHLARERFANDRTLQLEVLQGIRTGLTQSGISIDENTPDELAPLLDWASDLAQPLLGPTDAVDQTLPWTSADDTWTTSTTRACADGQKNVLLWTSFPNGETRTSTSRSATFPLSETFSFYLAGHDGDPSKPAQGLNAVRLRHAKSNEILHSTAPPRQDTAQRIHWDTSTHAGQDAYLELIDQDNGTAYAWLAVGRFSVPSLNPSNRPAEQSLAAQLIHDFHLSTYQPTLEAILRHQPLPNEATAPLAQTYLSLTKAPSLLGKTLDLPTPDLALKQRTVDAILSGQAPQALLGQWMTTLPKASQTRLAEYAAATSDGATALLALVESGQAPADLLQSPTIDQLLTANLTPSQQAIKNDLTTNLISNDDAMETRITKRIQSFQKHGGSAPAGQALFQKHCTVCHQLGGAGTILGPNLDGIGNRGIERLTEDVLNPSRNVDIAFRLTTLSLTDGSSQVGLIKRTEGTQTILADPTGKESSITTSSIASKTSLTLSLMPATFADALSETEFRDLQAYLISLRN